MWLWMACAPSERAVVFSTPTVGTSPSEATATSGWGTCAALAGAERFGGEADEAMTGTAAGPDGETTHAGWFDGPLPLDGEPLVPLGELGYAVVRRDADGALRWAATLHGSTQAHLKDVAVGADGAAWAAGSGDGLSSFAFGPPLGGAGESDAWVARLGADGALTHTLVVGSPAEDSVYGLAALPDGGVAVGGAYGGAVEIGDAALTLPEGALAGGWLARLDADGEVVWASSVAGAAGAAFVNVAYDSTTDTIVASGVTYGSGETEVADLTLVPDGYDHFIVRYDASSGAPIWATALTGAYAVGRDLDVAEDGGIVAAGLFTGDVEVGGQTPTVLAGGGGWVARWDPAGRLLHATPIATTGTVVQVRAAPMPGGDVAIAGAFTRTLTVDERTFGAASADGYLVRLAPDGRLVCALHLAGAGASLDVADLQADAGGVELVGALDGSVTIEGAALASAGERDWLVVDLEWASP